MMEMRAEGVILSYDIFSFFKRPVFKGLHTSFVISLFLISHVFWKLPLPVPFMPNLSLYAILGTVESENFDLYFYTMLDFLFFSFPFLRQSLALSPG